MGIEALLYKSYNRRKLLLNLFLALCYVPTFILAVGFTLEEVSTLRDPASWIIAANENSTFLLVGSIYTLLVPMCCCGWLKRYVLRKNKMKIEYMESCIRRQSIAQQNTIDTEAEFFLNDDNSIAIVGFGQDCIYCKHATNEHNQFAYPVIMPYRNIQQVMLHESFKKDFNKEISAAVTIASAALAATGVASLLTVVNLESVSTFIIRDDDGNRHYIPCGENSPQVHESIVYYVEQIIEHAPHVQVQYIEAATQPND